MKNMFGMEQRRKVKEILAMTPKRYGEFLELASRRELEELLDFIYAEKILLEKIAIRNLRRGRKGEAGFT